MPFNCREIAKIRTTDARDLRTRSFGDSEFLDYPQSTIKFVNS